MACALSTVVALLCPRAALAVSSRVVLILEDAGPVEQPVDDHLSGALRGQLLELGVDVTVVHQSRAPLVNAARSAAAIATQQRARGAVWLEERASALSVFLYDAKGHLYTRVVERDGSATSQSEAVAIILRSAIAAMLEGNSVSMTEVALPPPPPAPVRSAAAPRTPAVKLAESYFRLGPSYVGTRFARGGGWQHGGALTVDVGPSDARWFVGCDYTLFAAVHLQGVGAELRLHRHPIEAFGGLRWRVSPISLSFLGAVSADYVARSTTRVSEGLSPTANDGRWLWALSPRVGATLPISQRISGMVNVGADFVLNPFDQVVTRSEASPAAVGAILSVRPRLELGIVTTIW